ncbi:cell envelope integrity protein TolA [Psychrobacter sp. B38]|uniref:cell envelope integrity protein TolA n=1 Tax=Psychrobacter sp. B38 TaxID=3143538 RepID=UPI003210216E
MHNAPIVYVPTQPEGNGLTLPMLLSLLAHGLVIGVLIYTYQHTEVEPTGSIETVMVSPEQLAEMQGQILANRAAAASAMQAESSATSMTQTETFDGGASTQNPNQTSSQRVPVFTRSDDASQPMLMSDDQRQRILDQNQEYERRMAEWAAQLDDSVTEEHDQVEQNRSDQRTEEQERLGDYRVKQNTPPKINRPTASNRNIEITTGSSGKTYNLSDGESSISGDTSNQSSNKGSGSRSIGDVKSAIADKIERNLKAPTDTQGLTARVRLKLDSRGNVLSADANGSNPKVNQAAEDAAFAASPLPIDFDNAANFADLIINVTVQ